GPFGQARLTAPARRQIRELRWLNLDAATGAVQIRPVQVDGRTVGKILLQARVAPGQSVLVDRTREIPVDAEGNFTIALRIGGPQANFILTSVDLDGEAREEEWTLAFPEYVAWA